tara:strand:+ start:65 stop:223 length:159 start_codon:yes stop_codon:yes gene_type:complete
MEQRTYINLEKSSIVKILELITEIEQSRDLQATEKFLRIIFQNAIDTMKKEM